jgi:hypothetical protein
VIRSAVRLVPHVGYERSHISGLFPSTVLSAMKVIEAITRTDISDS